MQSGKPERRSDLRLKVTITAASLKQAYAAAVAAKPAQADIETVRSQLVAIDKAIGIDP